MENLFIPLVCLIVGFFINTFWQLYREGKNRKEKIEQIKKELQSNYHEIHQKKDHIKKIINQLNSKKILPGTSVNFITTYYSTFLNEVYPYLSALERNSLHVIYQYFELTDRKMNNFESDIIKLLSLDLFENNEKVYQLFSVRFEELLDTLNNAESLIKNHLNGKPTDVFYINTEHKPEQLA